MIKFEFFPHTADVGIAAYGKDLQETFANAAVAMFTVISDLDQVSELESREVAVSGEDLEALLVEWLNELLFIFDVEHLLLKRFDVWQLGEKHLKATVRGEKYDPTRHHLLTGVKAATYHQVQVSTTDRYKAQFILDV